MKLFNIAFFSTVDHQSTRHKVPLINYVVMIDFQRFRLVAIFFSLYGCLPMLPVEFPVSRWRCSNNWRGGFRRDRVILGQHLDLANFKKNIMRIGSDTFKEGESISSTKRLPILGPVAMSLNLYGSWSLKCIYLNAKSVDKCFRLFWRYSKLIPCISDKFNTG